MNPTDYLNDVPQENYFRLADGRVIRNLEELYSIIGSSGDTVFYDHVTPDRNDFASWIRECVKHHELYAKLLPLKDRQSFISVLSQEIETLKNPKIAETMKFFSDDYYSAKDASSAAPQSPPSISQPVTQTSVAQTSVSQPSVSQPAVTTPQQATPINAQSDNLILDFEQILAQLVQEIKEEIFFWQ